MKYLLRITTFDKIPDIEITADEYKKLENAQKVLSNALEIEVKYDIMIANYLEFEKQILQKTATVMVRNIADYPGFFEIRQSLNISLVNLLTSTKLYHDQLNQNVSKCVPDDPCIKNKIEGLFKKEAGENINYRFMEALRDYVQHMGLSVHWTQHAMRLTSSDDDGLFEYNLEFGLELSRLKADRKFEKRGLSELGENINLKSSTRSYIESLSNVHESSREITVRSVSEARKLVENTHLRYPNVYSGSLATLCACKQTNGGQLTSIPLLLNWDNIRLELQIRNKKLTNLRKRYVTGIIKARSE
jgi:hypothetical protein